MEVSEFYYLVDCAVVAAANLFAIPQTNRRRTALLRSYTIAALDNVVIVFRSDCGSAFRNARSTTGFGEIRSAFPRPRARRNRAIIKRPSPQRLSPVRARFFSRSTGNVYPNAKARTQVQYQRCATMTTAAHMRARVRGSRHRALQALHARAQCHRPGDNPSPR